MPQASDLGYLLHKHPDRAQSVDTSVGTAHVFWPESSPECATVVLLLEVDPIALVRGKGGRDNGFSLAQYVNDRPYAATSMLAVALSKVFRTAMTGRCDARPDLVGRWSSELPMGNHPPPECRAAGGSTSSEWRNRIHSRLLRALLRRRLDADRGAAHGIAARGAPISTT